MTKAHRTADGCPGEPVDYAVFKNDASTAESQ